MEDVIRTENLTKHYRSVHAVENVSLQVRKGEIYGFLGLNGAGKTPAIRMLLGMIRPTKGSAYLWGRKVVPNSSDLIYWSLTVIKLRQDSLHVLTSPDPETLPEHEYEDHFFRGPLKNRVLSGWEACRIYRVCQTNARSQSVGWYHPG